jgi:hypothetical protein
LLLVLSDALLTCAAAGAVVNVSCFGACRSTQCCGDHHTADPEPHAVSHWLHCGCWPELEVRGSPQPERQPSALSSWSH